MGSSGEDVIPAGQVPLSVLRRSSGASGAERGDSRCAPLVGLACGSRSLLSRRDRDHWFLAVGRLSSCCRVSLASSAPSAARVSARLHPSSSCLPFRVPSLILPPLLSGALPDSGLQALFAADRRRPLTARASDPRYVPSLGFLNPPTVFSAFDPAGVSGPAATSRVLSARPGRPSLSRWTHRPAASGVPPRGSTRARAEYLESAQEDPGGDIRSGVLATREALAWNRRPPAQPLRADPPDSRP